MIIHLTWFTQFDFPFEWFVENKLIFIKINEFLIIAPILNILVEVKGFTIYCNAFNIGFYYVLMQHRHVIAYASSKHSIHEAQLPHSWLGVCVGKFPVNIGRHYRYGVCFETYTDHMSLQFSWSRRTLIGVNIIILRFRRTMTSIFLII